MTNYGKKIMSVCLVLIVAFFSNTALAFSDVETMSAFYGVYSCVDKEEKTYNIDLVNEKEIANYEFAKSSDAVTAAKLAYANGDDNTGSFVWAELDDEGRVTVLNEVAKYQKDGDSLNKVLVSDTNIVYGEGDNEYFVVKEFTFGSYDEEQKAIVNDEDENDFIKVNNATILVNLTFDDKGDSKASNDEFSVEFEEGIEKLDLVKNEKVVVIYDADETIVRAKYVIVWNRLGDVH